MFSASLVPAVPAPAPDVPVIDITSSSYVYVPTLALTLALAPVPYKAFIGTEFPQTPSPGRVIPKGSWLYDTCDCKCPYVEAKKPQQESPPAIRCCEKCCNCTSASK